VAEQLGLRPLARRHQLVTTGAQLRELSLPDGSYASAQNLSRPCTLGELHIAVYV
jgi:hypothetical protein